MQIIKKISTLAVLMFFCITVSLNAQTLISHDFNDGKLSPFWACSVSNPNYTIAENGRVKNYWIESSIDGARETKGAELCYDGIRTLKHGGYGLTVNLGADYQMDKQAGIAQIFQFSSENFWSWAAMLDMNIIMGFTLSDIGEGELPVWENGESVYHATNIYKGIRPDLILSLGKKVEQLLLFTKNN